MVKPTVHSCSVHTCTFCGVTSRRRVQDHLWEELWHSLAKHMVQGSLSVSLVSSLRPGTIVTLAT